MPEPTKTCCATCDSPIEVWISTAVEDDGTETKMTHWRHENQHPRESDHDIRPPFPMLPIHCAGCGALRGWDGEVPPPNHCDQCPPWKCHSCGRMDSMADPCPCWVSLEGKNLADLKAIFALGDMSIVERREGPDA